MSLTFKYFSIFFFIFISCGPRSGVHNTEKNPEIDYSQKTDTGSSQYKTRSSNQEIYKKGEKLFKQNCATCHYAGKSDIITGPGFAVIADRLPQPAEEWFVGYTLNNDSVAKSGDKYAKSLKVKFKGSDMNIFTGYLSSADVRCIYFFLTNPSMRTGCVQ